jgi:ferredoxin
LIYGRDETAIEAGNRLKDVLDVTVLLDSPKDVSPPRRDDFPVARGTIAAAKGYLGAFELTVDNFALPSPSSRAALVFGPGRRGTSKADIILDLSGGTPLFPAPELRQGYVRADPAARADVAEAIFAVSLLTGEFDKPRYIRYTESLCAHERSKKTGCTRCLELCPAGAINPNGDHVAISAEICMGCGQCASVCPTGAAAYDFPPASTLLSQVRAILIAYRKVGGQEPILLFHDAEHGGQLIDALARFGAGLPANVIPIQVNEVTQIGLETLVASFAYGAAGLRFLLKAKPKHSPEGLQRNIAFAEAILSGLGFGYGLASMIETDDPDALGQALTEGVRSTPLKAVSEFLPLGSGRGLLKLALEELRNVAPEKSALIPMPPRAPVGGLKINAEGCTLCLACVGACPTGALLDNPERPMLRFSEDLCVQCGLCQATCPERVISLEPRLNFEAWTAPPAVIKEEEPFHCINCGKPFGVKSTIERITAKLEGRHWMYSGENAGRVAVLKMCDDCRVEVVVNEGFDPKAAPPRPALRTSDDYFRERERVKDGEK